jgi:hypothetical protein
MRFDREVDRLVVRHDGIELVDYVYRPVQPQLESPRPYALLRTVGGAVVTGFRPDDHVWHKGLSLALPNVGPHNFWGGPTYVAGEGYVQLPNNGAQVHRAFGESSASPDGDAAAIDEDVDWISQGGGAVLVERRSLTARIVADDVLALTWRSRLRNESGEPLAFGSPTSKGRADAGYAGIFWRGPTWYTGGDILGPEGVVGDAARGRPSPWLAIISPDRTAGVVMLDAGATPSPWFARSAEYAGLCPAPFFFDETVLAPGDAVVLSTVVLVGDADVARHAPTAGAALVAELRASEHDLPGDGDRS